jgi:hypothetical protein
MREINYLYAHSLFRYPIYRQQKVNKTGLFGIHHTIWNMVYFRMLSTHLGTMSWGRWGDEK